VDIGQAITRPISNRLLKAACGHIFGIALFGWAASWSGPLSE